MILYTILTQRIKDVVTQMREIAASMGAWFTLSMGDNFYDNGVTGEEDPRFEETFEVNKLNEKRAIQYRLSIPAADYLYEALGTINYVVH